ncbi:histidinol-phosphatase [Aeromicrobium sp. SORGH_AS981]|uniref:inositol monophosphatase family protein n=1 Tax=Aeromicrobium sp. SORGH_AS_0981 TaxID=3041802 RepID=UPI00285FCEE1|nr:inositol monophosphatase family protein [Aeromicrobium sp. SORGH_AS_0981]MDR6120035.1 histidinol-phosphatase [Aeromicrobium sp. SORGH_AS_0981]
MTHSWNDDVRLAHVLADTADNLSMDRFGAIDLEVSTKPDMSYVTESDQAVEAAIRRVLKSARTRDVVLGEEQGEELGSTGSHERRWIIDPIDGTSNFVRGVPVWATLVALEEDGEIVAGLVSAPALGRRWWASKGAGAYTGKSFMHARQIRCSQVSDLSAASLSFSSAPSWEQIDKADAFWALARRCWRTRAYGDFWSYMLVAEGAVDIAAEPELKLWDMAALDVIVREAGGRFTALDGTDGPWGVNAVATNGRLHDAAMAYLGHFPDEAADDDAEGDDTAPGSGEGRGTVSRIDFSRSRGGSDAT